ncbi:MAG: RagB/SusD family nutrient uptake outer membrane protein [Dysgonamonadaceae bacterium]|jgi:hypothetical protein|nr:RagB/SusD family nutrient uptake outer membrane protein [Dysgonamonadaceae bacterium]
MKIYKTIMLQAAVLLAMSGCNVEPEYYSEMGPMSVFEAPQRVYERLASVYVHVAYNEGIGFHNSSWSFLQEFNTDELCLPIRGTDWEDDQEYVRHYLHDYTPSMRELEGAWNAVGMGVAKAYQAKEDLDTYADFNKLFPEDPEGVRDAVLMQLDVIVAMCYLRGLDFFGGYPIYYSNKDTVKGRNSDREVFEFIEKLLTDALPKLPKKANPNAVQTGYVDQGVAAALLARLYFNAESYIQESRFADCARICELFLQGEYGVYQQAGDYRNVFGWGNETCGEIIWSIPSDNSKYQWNFGNYEHMLHYESWKTLNFPGLGALVCPAVPGLYNGWCLTPSLDGDSLCYAEGRTGYGKGVSPKAFKLGSPYAKFEDTDVRKKQYVYKGGGTYEGMFLVGPQGYYDGVDENGRPKIVGAIGSREYSGKPLVIVDQIAYLSRRGDADFAEGIKHGEENSGIRLIKFSPIPNGAEQNLMFNPDRPIIRLPEIKYMLAECKLRDGATGPAATLINEVRARYFEDGNDPNPVTAANLDKYRMLDEWMIEFLGENRRRTDLIRWGEFTNGRWFDHEPDGQAHLNRLPLHEKTIGANQLLTPNNPGYN